MSDKQYTMKESGVPWIGEMPESWNCLKTKYLATITNGADPVAEGDIPVYGSGSNSFRTCGEFKEGPAVLVGRKGSIDKPRYVEGKYWNVDTAFDVKEKGKFSIKLYYYLACCFEYPYYTSQTTLPSMTQSNYYNMYLPVPPLAEQEAIAAYLDEKCGAIDEIIAGAKATIEEYKAWKASVIFEAVTKGLDPNAEMKDSGVEWIGRVPKGWNIVHLKRVARIQTGNTPSKQDSATYYSKTDGIPWIKPDNLGLSICITKTEEYLTETGAREARVNAANSVYVCCIGSIGKVGFAENECACNQQINAVTFNEEQVHWKFGFYSVISQEAQHWFYSNGNVLKILNTENQKKIQICSPSIKEQTAIVAFLDRKCSAIDAIIAEKQTLIGDLESYKKSLIFETVTGKRRVYGNE